MRLVKCLFLEGYQDIQMREVFPVVRNLDQNFIWLLTSIYTT
jgi:hypothetical protein